MQLPVNPVGTGRTVTVDPCNAPVVTVALTVGTGPATVKLHVIVDVSPLFHVTNTVPDALPVSPPNPTVAQPNVPVPENVPLPPVYGTPVIADVHGVSDEAEVPSASVPPIFTDREASVTPGEKVSVAADGQVRSTGAAKAVCRAPMTAEATNVASSTLRAFRLIRTSPPVMFPLRASPTASKIRRRRQN
jgi:hypothetical protein